MKTINNLYISHFLLYLIHTCRLDERLFLLSYNISVCIHLTFFVLFVYTSHFRLLNVFFKFCIIIKHKNKTQQSWLIVFTLRNNKSISDENKYIAYRCCSFAKNIS